MSFFTKKRVVDAGSYEIVTRNMYRKVVDKCNSSILVQQMGHTPCCYGNYSGPWGISIYLLPIRKS